MWPHGDPRDLARAILAGPHYRVAPEAAGRAWWEYLWDGIRVAWDRLVGPIGKAIGNELVSTIVGTIVLIAALAFLVFVVVRFVRPYRVATIRRTVPGPSPLADEPDARALRERALVAAAEGRHRDAAALLWASALRALDERGEVRYDPSRTPGEWRRAVRDPAFDALARDAVLALFGDRPVDATLVARMRTAYERVVVSA